MVWQLLKFVEIMFGLVSKLVPRMRLAGNYYEPKEGFHTFTPVPGLVVNNLSSPDSVQKKKFENPNFTTKEKPIGNCCAINYNTISATNNVTNEIVIQSVVPKNPVTYKKKRLRRRKRKHRRKKNKKSTADKKAAIVKHSWSIKTIENRNSDSSSEDGSVCQFGSVTNRRLSNTDSEDSFIIFASDSEDEDCCFCDKDFNGGTSSLSSSSQIVPIKVVRFAEDSELCEVHPMVQWSFAYQAARKGPWESYARDRLRFGARIHRMEAIIAPVFNEIHRCRMYEERFKDQ